MTSQRLFVGNLPVTVDSETIRQAFLKYGEVSDVELKVKQCVNTELPSNKTFAYINIVFKSERRKTKCFEKEFEIGGQTVNVQPAKDNFLKRLQEEREGIPTKVPHRQSKRHDREKVNELSNGYKVNGHSRQEDPEVEVSEAAQNNLNDEKSRNLNILETVFKKPFISKDSLPPPRPVLITRYDPTSPTASKFEIKKRKEPLDESETSPDKGFKSKKILGTQTSKQKHQELNSQEKNNEEKSSESGSISQHRFHAVNSNLKSIFAKKQTDSEKTSSEFKLSALFDCSSVNETSSTNLQFGSDSLGKEISKKSKIHAPINGHVTSSTTVASEEVELPKERYFFSKNDLRLLEDPFFKPPKQLENLKSRVNSQACKQKMNQVLAAKKKLVKSRKYRQVSREKKVSFLKPASNLKGKNET